MDKSTTVVGFPLSQLGFKNPPLLATISPTIITVRSKSVRYKILDE